MKTKDNSTLKSKEFDAVKTFRTIKEKISNDLIGLNSEEIKKYLKKNSLELEVE